MEELTFFLANHKVPHPDLFLQDIQDWINENNIEAEWFRYHNSGKSKLIIGPHYGNNVWYWPTHITFYNEDDAVVFKLMFCGVGSGVRQL